MPSKQDKQKKTVEKSNASRSLCATFDAGKSSRARLPETSFAVIDSGKLFKSPLEKYLEKQRDTLKTSKEREKQVLATLQEYNSVNKKQGSVGQGDDGPICSNCHQRKGHNRLNCHYNECQSFFHCGDINKHSEEKMRMKEVDRQHRELLRQISALENELKVKEASVTSLQDRYIYKVRNILIESNPSRYLSVGTGVACERRSEGGNRRLRSQASTSGNYVENWFQLNKDARKLQSILKGNVPAPGTNLQRLLTESPDNTLNESVFNKGKTSVRNPYRKLCEQRGVQWPACKVKDVSNTCKSSTSLSSSSSWISPDVDEVDDETPPSLSDDFVLALGIRESLKTTSIEDKPVVMEPELAVLFFNNPILSREFRYKALKNRVGVFLYSIPVKSYAMFCKSTQRDPE